MCFYEYENVSSLLMNILSP